MKNIERTGIYQSSEIAELFGLAERHLWPLLKSGELLGRKIGRHWYCTGQDILDFVSSGNQTGITHDDDEKQAANIKHLYRSILKENAQLKDILPTLSSKDADAANALSFDNLLESTPADKTHTSDSKLTPRQQRRKAVMDAYTATGSYQAAAEALNQQVAEGGPKPERGDSWTADRVRQTIARLRKIK